MNGILAIDPHPTKPCGWAHSDGTSGTFSVDRARPLFFLARWIISMYERTTFGTLVVEDAAMGSPNFTIQNQHSEIRGVIRYAAQTCLAEFVTVHPTSLKAWATGSGRADKAKMLRHAEIQYGRKFQTDDECDAFWLLKYVEAGQHLRVAEDKAQRKEAAKKSKQFWRRSNVKGRLFK